jgi:hypothetical protein
MRYCPQCGNQVKDTDSFCGKCGCVLSNPTQSPREPERRPELSSWMPALILSILLITASFAGVFLMGNSTDTDANYHLKYSWSYDDHSYEYTLDVSKSDYSKMLSSDIDKSGTVSSDLYERADGDTVEIVFGVKDYIVVDSYIMKLKDALYERYTGTYGESSSNLEFPDFIVAFVQECITYQDDTTKGASEYWKYPLETLYDRTGDCEDFSILAAALLDAAGHEAGIYLLPGHAMGAISKDLLKTERENLQFDGHYAIELTSPGNKIGYVNDAYGDCYFHLYTGNTTSYHVKSS